MKQTSKDSPYPQRKDNFGMIKAPYSERFDPLLIKALNIYKLWHKETYGYDPSRADIFATSVLQHNDRIRKIYRKLETEERKDGRKYLDGIKSQRPRAATDIELEISNDVNNIL